MSFRFPGFRDSHCHPLFAGRELIGPVVTGCRSIAEIQQTLRDYRTAHPEAQWIDCGSYNRNLAPDGRFLAVWLDEAVSDIPVVVHADDHHTCWVNTQALSVAGLLGELPQLTSGSIDTDASGRATGVLREWEAMNMVYVHQPPLSLSAELDALEAAHRMMGRSGVVGVQDAWIDPGMEEIYLAAAQAKRLILPTNLAPRINPETWKADLTFAESVRERISSLGDPLLTCRTVKVFADGVLGSGTAALLEPYEDIPGSGQPLWTNESLTEVALLADASGFQLHIHAIGDAGVRQSIDVLETVRNTNPAWDRRSVIAHLELVSDSDIPRLARNQISVSIQPLWGRPDDMFASSAVHIGEVRAARLYRTNELLEAGVRVSFGSDWPVSSPNPLEGLYVATERALTGFSAALGPEQRISLEAAMTCYTEASARSNYQEDRLLTDWVELSANPANTPKEKWVDIHAVRSQIGDRIYEWD